MSAISTASPFLRTGLTSDGLGDLTSDLTSLQGDLTSLQEHRAGAPELSLELVLECLTEDPLEFR